MKTRFSTKTIAMGTAAGLLIAGLAAIGIPAIAANNGHKVVATKSVGKAKATKTKAKNGVATSTTSPSVPPTIPPAEDGDGDGGFGRHGMGPNGMGPDRGQVLKDTLGELVTKGTITQAQSDAILAALDAKRAAADSRRAQLRAKADAIIAEVLGITVEEFKTKMQNHTLTPPTAEQMQQIKTKLDELRTSLGLPAEPLDGPGMGGRHHGGKRGHGGPGMGFGPMPGTPSGSGA